MSATTAADVAPFGNTAPLVAAVLAAARRWPAVTAAVDAATGRGESYAALAELVARRAREVSAALAATSPPRDGGHGRPVAAVEHGHPEGVDLLVDVLAVAAAGAVALVRNPAHPDEVWRRQRGTARPVVTLRPGEVHPIGSAAARLPLHPSTYQLVATSGSTGEPKLVQLTHSGTSAAAEVYRGRVSLRVGEAVAVPQSLATVGALPSGVLPALLSGGTAVLGHGWGVRTFVAALARHEAVFAMAVTGWWQACLAAPWPPLPALRVLGVGGSPWHHLVPEVQRRVPHVEVLGNYGLTETHGPALQVSTREVADAAGITGRPVAGLEAAVRDEAGARQPPGQRGVLWLRGPLVTPGCIGPDGPAGPVGSSGPDRGGWLCTRDVVTAGRDGWLRVVDRADDIVNVAGRKVYPAEVEVVLRRVPGVADCAVVRSDAPADRRRLGAFVVPGPAGVDVAAARRTVREALGSHAVPASLDIVTGLPRTGSGKVDREALRRRLNAPAAE
jgi:acyl-CoA synthetase (AMP-forming)/AMP-acid ligase II